ncbi:MAG: TadE/TadG family type IV pilus assembly protein [Nocardioidaceae bacterium]|nr:TadE/TadG family type IV pilus assembly protein [Nocardioidaceae bacterium]
MSSSTRDRGAAAVEFALIAPILMMMVLGIVEFGSLYKTNITMTNAAMTAARSFAAGDSSTSVAARTSTATTVARSASERPSATVAISCTTGACASGDNVTVTVTYREPLLTGLFGANRVLSGKGTARCG